jgi:hypothetical protein
LYAGVLHEQLEYLIRHRQECAGPKLSCRECARLAYTEQLLMVAFR